MILIVSRIVLSEFDIINVKMRIITEIWYRTADLVCRKKAKRDVDTDKMTEEPYTEKSFRLSSQPERFRYKPKLKIWKKSTPFGII